MSGRKNVLAPVHWIVSGAMASNVTSNPVNIQMGDNIAIQLNWTGTPSGTFQVQVSVDHKQDAQGAVQVAGTWIPLALSAVPTAAGSADSAYINLTQLSAPWVRVVYLATSGSGTLEGYITFKML